MDEMTLPADTAPVDTASDPLRQYRTWAFRFFAIMAAVVMLGALLLLTAHDADPYEIATILVIAGLSLGLLTALLRGIDRQAAWAIQAIAPTCTVIIVFGILRAVIALFGNSITIPLEVIGAWMVLSRPHHPASLPGLRSAEDRKVTLIVGAMAVSQLLPYAIGTVGTGGILGVQPEDLDLSITMACDQLGEGGTAPVRVTWSWRRPEFLSPAADGLLLSWYGSTNAVEPAPDGGVYLPNEPTTSDPRIGIGGEGLASAALQPYAQQGPFTGFRVDHRGGLLGGEIAFDLARSERVSTFGLISVQVWYAHGGRWVERYESEQCRWGTQPASG